MTAKDTALHPHRPLTIDFITANLKQGQLQCKDISDLPNETILIGLSKIQTQDCLTQKSTFFILYMSPQTSRLEKIFDKPECRVECGDKDRRREFHQKET